MVKYRRLNLYQSYVLVKHSLLVLTKNKHSYTILPTIQSKKMRWKTLKSKTIIKNRFFNLLEESYKKTDGKIINKFYTVKRKDVAVIAAFTKNKKIVLISQYRPSVKISDLELPAGYMEKGEKNIKQTAERELLEETGYKTKKLIKIGEAFVSAGFMNNKVHFFIGFDAEKISEQKLDSSEEIEVKITSWKKALNLVKKGKIKDLGSVTGMMLAERYLKKVFPGKNWTF